MQIKVRSGRSRSSHPLSSRFQKTVYRAAYRAKAITGEAYINEWNLSEWHEREETAEEVITAVITELEAAYDDKRLDKLARNRGYDPQEQ